MDNGKRLIIDEFDSKMHPLLTCRIITLFNSKETNPKNAQLIFTTHDTNLLSANIFRRDQIWFTQKDRYGATELIHWQSIKFVMMLRLKKITCPESMELFQLSEI